MTGSASKRKTRSGMIIGLQNPPVASNAKETLRGHLQNLLDELPQDLPTYYHEALLDDLCFLIGSPLFLCAISPRIRRGEQTLASSPKTATTRVPVKNNLCSKPAHKANKELEMTNLRMEIERLEQGWVTRLLYKTATLIEGRECLPSKDTGFIPSFRFFCEEAEFLGYEFRAREHAAAVACGRAVDDETRENAFVADKKKKRRLVKLRIRFKIARGKVRKTAR